MKKADKVTYNKCADKETNDVSSCGAQKIKKTSAALTKNRYPAHSKYDIKKLRMVGSIF